MSTRTVVITGANGRLGGRLSEALAEEDSYQVARIVRTEEQADRLANDLGDERGVFSADVTESSAVEDCFDRIVEELGSIYGLIHTVGAWGETPIEGGDPESWRRMVEINLTSTYLVFRAGLERLGPEGRLIAFTSEQGADGGVGGQSAYSAAKAGVARLVESTAEETAAGITAHAVAPSFIRFDPEAEMSGVEPEEIVAACRFLLGEAGRAFDGQILRAYGPAG